MRLLFVDQIIHLSAVVDACVVKALQLIINLFAARKVVSGFKLLACFVDSNFIQSLVRKQFSRPLWRTSITRLVHKCAQNQHPQTRSSAHLSAFTVEGVATNL